jgi:disulfide bond formation protein DsbB
MSEIYSGLASFGKVQSIIGLLFVGLIFVIMIGIGIYFIVNNTKYKKTLATVVSSDCQQINGKYNCDIKLNYTIQSNIYNSFIKLSGFTNDVKVNETVEIEYNTSDPTSIRSVSSFNKYFGWILIGIALVIFIFGVVSTFLVFKYKPYAAYTGIQSLLPVVNRNKVSLINI